MVKPPLNTASVVLPVVMLLVGASRTLAQAAPAPPSSVLAGIRSGSVVRARLGAEQTMVGRYLPVGDGRLGVTDDRGVTDTLRLAQLRELSVRGRHTKTGAILGGAAGAAFGVFVGIIITATCETDDCNGVRPYLVTVPLFGAGGALLGAAVGAAIPRWRRVFP